MGEGPLLGSAQAAEAPLPAVGKATVFVMVSEGVPEAEGDADIIYYVPGAFQHLQGRKGVEWGVLGAPGGQLPPEGARHHGCVCKDRASPSHCVPCTTHNPGASSADLAVNAASKLATREETLRGPRPWI